MRNFFIALAFGALSIIVTTPADAGSGGGKALDAELDRLAAELVAAQDRIKLLEQKSNEQGMTLVCAVRGRGNAAQFYLRGSSEARACNEVGRGMLGGIDVEQGWFGCLNLATLAFERHEHIGNEPSFVCNKSAQVR